MGVDVGGGTYWNGVGPSGAVVDVARGVQVGRMVLVGVSRIGVEVSSVSTAGVVSSCVVEVSPAR